MSGIPGSTRGSVGSGNRLAAQQPDPVRRVRTYIYRHTCTTPPPSTCYTTSFLGPGAKEVPWNSACWPTARFVTIPSAPKPRVVAAAALGVAGKPVPQAVPASTWAQRESDPQPSGASRWRSGPTHPLLHVLGHQASLLLEGRGAVQVGRRSTLSHRGQRRRMVSWTQGCRPSQVTWGPTRECLPHGRSSSG